MLQAVAGRAAGRAVRAERVLEAELRAAFPGGAGVLAAAAARVEEPDLVRLAGELHELALLRAVAHEVARRVVVVAGLDALGEHRTRRDEALDGVFFAVVAGGALHGRARLRVGHALGDGRARGLLALDGDLFAVRSRGAFDGGTPGGRRLAVRRDGIARVLVRARLHGAGRAGVANLVLRAGMRAALLLRLDRIRLARDGGAIGFGGVLAGAAAEHERGE